MDNYDRKARDYIERQILGSLIMAEDHEEVKHHLLNHGLNSGNFFGTKIHQDIYNTVLKIWEKGNIANMISISTEKPRSYFEEDKEPVNMDGYMVQISMEVVTNSDFEYNIWLFKQYIFIDFWNKKSQDISSSNWSDRDVLLVGNNIVEGYNNLYDKMTSVQKKQDNDDLISKAQEKFDKVRKGEIVAIPTGIKTYDDFATGWQAPELSIIAARPSMGKTTIALASAKYSAYEKGVKVAFFSLEMSRQQLMNKVIASVEPDIEYDDIKNYKLSSEKFKRVLEWYKHFEDESNLRIYDITQARTLTEIVKIILDGKFDLAVIDYLQLIKMDKKMKSSANREQEVSEISRTLKLTCNQGDLPIIALSQLSRGVENRINKRPILSDLRESGAIEQDADNVVFIYRDTYYQEQRDGANANIPEIEKGNFEWILAKGRDTGTNAFKNHIDFKTYALSPNFKFNDGTDHSVKKLPEGPPPPSS